MGSAKSGGYVNGGSIDPVIVGMGPDKMNANDPVKSPGHISVANANDYTIVVPFDVEGVSPSRVLPSWEHRMIPLRARQ